MWDLYKAEVIRLRGWALAALVVHVGVLGFLARMVDPLQQPTRVYEIVAALYGLAGLLLGLYQMSSYRRANTWINLLHRPLAPVRIAAALHGAGATLLIVAVAVPLMLIIAGQAGLSARVVDARHAWLPLAAGLIATCGYLAGAYTMLAPRRWSPLVLVLPAWLAMSMAVGVGAIIVQAIVLAWLSLLVAAAFKPELDAAPHRALYEVATALPIQMAIYLLLVMSSLVYQLGWMVVGSHPLNGTPPAGGFVEASRAVPRERLQAGLAGSTHPDAALWREQVAISEVHTLGVQIEAYPVRGELTNLVPMEFDDEQRRVRWTFSHDSMRYEGVALATRAAAGTLGDGTAATFAAPPLVLGNDALVSTHALRAFDSRTGEIAVRLALAGDETLASLPEAIGESTLVLSDRALHFYATRALRAATSPPLEHTRLDVPGPIGELADVDVVELLDGHLVSFLFGRGSIDGPGEAWQDIWRLGDDGSAERIARRELAADFPSWLRHLRWWLSPTLDTLRQTAITLFAEPSPTQVRAADEPPAGIIALAVVLLACALALGFVVVRRSELPPGRRLAWLLACAGVGVPALIALALIHRASLRRTKVPASRGAA